MTIGGRAVGDGQILDGDGVPVFETAVTDLSPRQVPAPANGVDGFDRADIALGQTVEACNGRVAAGDTSDSSSTRKSSGWHLSFIGIREGSVVEVATGLRMVLFSRIYRHGHDQGMGEPRGQTMHDPLSGASSTKGEESHPGNLNLGPSRNSTCPPPKFEGGSPVASRADRLYQQFGRSFQCRGKTRGLMADRRRRPRLRPPTIAGGPGCSESPCRVPEGIPLEPGGK